MTPSTTLRNLRKLAATLLVLLFWLAVWFLIAVIVDKEILVASPLQVTERLLELLPSPDFQKSVALSVIRIFLGFLTGVVV